MSDPDDEPTPEELEEAERLAAALEGSGREHAPEDALASAAFLRQAGGHYHLDAAARDRLVEEALAEARPPGRSETPPWWERLGFRIGIVVGAVAATAALLLLLRAAPAPTALPEPPPALLRAQASALAGHGPEELGREMDAYRGQVYAALSERYR
jgi:hypothetical protein